MMLRMLVLVVATAFSLGAGAADRVLLHLVHEYVDFVDRGTISAYFRTWVGESGLGCPLPVTQVRIGNKIVLTSSGGMYQPNEVTCGQAPYEIGTLEAGTYEVTARALKLDGTLFAESKQTLNVAQSSERCNPTPGGFPSVTMLPTPPLRREDVVVRLNTDHFFANALGNPVTVRLDQTSDGFDGVIDLNTMTFEYPTLFNLREAMGQISVAVPWTTSYENHGGTCFHLPQQSVVRSNIEYFYPASDSYFYTNDAQEIDKLDAGAVGSVWLRTGKSFSAETASNCTDGQTAVYRFWGIPGVGPNAHFFTRDPAECSIVDQSKAWTFEGVAFWASQPNADGSCNPLQYLGQNRIPLYRAWRPFGKPSHRLSTDRAVINEMVTKGWVDEGAVMCVLPPA